VVEAINAYTQDDRRIVEELSLVFHAEDWESAWNRYKQVHHEDKRREYYCLHTDREQLEIGVLDVFGRSIKQHV